MPEKKPRTVRTVPFQARLMMNAYYMGENVTPLLREYVEQIILRARSEPLTKLRRDIGLVP